MPYITTHEPDGEILYNIAAVERDTGLSKDTLRVWERRYGFPQPLRDNNDERLYPQDQLDKLRRIRHLMDHGQRPSKLIHLNAEELAQLMTRGAEYREPPAAVAEILRLLLAHDIEGFRGALLQQLMKQGLQRFVCDTVAHLNFWIGDAWLHGKLAIFDEHLYSEHLQNILRNAILEQPGRGGAPRFLLTTVPGEKHRIGLLMVEAMLCIEGAACVALGNETPIPDIRDGALALRADVVALSFSAAIPTQTALAGLQELRAVLPKEIAIWAGGGALGRCRKAPEGVTMLRSLEEIPSALANARDANRALQAA